MKDNTGDLIEVEVDKWNRVTLDVHDSQRGAADEAGPATAVLSAAKARLLARKLLRAAAQLDGGSPSTAPRVQQISDEVHGFTSKVSSLANAHRRHGEELHALQAEQRWDREQIQALLAKVYGITAGPNAHEPEEPTQADGIREEAARIVREDQALTTSPRNATPISHETHYLLPAAWLRNTATAKVYLVAVPDGHTLEERISTGFDR